MKKKEGFTLAEVLITLGIIGVVAAITLPAINSNTGATRNRALLKKSLSTLNSAVRMNEAREGWNFANLVQGSGGALACDENVTPDTNNTICAMLNRALVGETFKGNIYKTIENTMAHYNGGINTNNIFATYELQDGVVIGLSSAIACTEDTKDNCGGYIDVNGDRGPNEIIKCLNSADTIAVWSSSYADCAIDPSSRADIFPFTYYDSTVELSSNAAKAYFNAR